MIEGSEQCGRDGLNLARVSDPGSSHLDFWIDPLCEMQDTELREVSKLILV
jgi:hypothetical protein